MHKPAARTGDMHICPMVTGKIPHVGGGILSPKRPTVMIGGMPAAKVGDKALCNGPSDTITTGSKTVMISGMPAARMGDQTAHKGIILSGCPTVLIGG